MNSSGVMFFGASSLTYLMIPEKCSLIAVSDCCAEKSATWSSVTPPTIGWILQTGSEHST
jgi:hypothetical protein